MALIKFGGGIVGMSGSMAGNTFARNRYGSYVRARTKPVNPNSARQIVVRAIIGTLTERWSDTLTAVQRTAWNLYAASVAMQNKLGETIHLSGFNHYIRSNSSLLDIGATLVDDGPTDFTLATQDGTFAVSASEATQLISVVFDDTHDWCDEDDAFMFLLDGSPVNAQRNFFNGPWRGIEKIEGDSVAAPTTPETHTAIFTLTEGQRFYVKARIIRPDGRLSNPFQATALCAA